MSRGVTTDEKVVESWTRTVADLVRKGTSIKNACLSSKITYSTFLDYYLQKEWVRAEVDGAKAEFLMKLEGKIQEFVEYDDMDLEARDLAKLREAQAKLALDLLSKVDKDKYSSRQEVTGKDGEAIKTESTNVIVEDNSYAEFLKTKVINKANERSNQNSDAI